jgi:hypothetical protein
MDLKTAIQKITDDYDFEEDATRDPAVAIQNTRSEIDHKEVDFWERDCGLDADLATAYRVVLDANDADIASALAPAETR